jgi:hypothetical protein
MNGAMNEDFSELVLSFSCTYNVVSGEDIERRTGMTLPGNRNAEGSQIPYKENVCGNPCDLSGVHT